MLKGNAPLREVLRKTAPGGEIELSRLAQLHEIAFQARAARQQLENARLIEHVHLVFPDHVINGGKLAAISGEKRRESGELIDHGSAPKANPFPQNPLPHRRGSVAIRV